MNGPPSQVLLRRSTAYEHQPLAGFVEESLRLVLGSSLLHGRTVLLKPNLISAGGPDHAVTDPRFIAVAATVLRDCGARVRLGDSPAFGSASRVCARRGIDRALSGLGVEIVDFDHAEPCTLSSGLQLPVAREALHCDLLVGLPKVKAHNQMYVTLAVKNLFGIVKGVRKAMLHMSHGASQQGFAEILCELPALLPRQLHLADGIVAMHRSGPLDGEPLPLYCMAAAALPVALDTALLAVLELDPRRSPLWQAAVRGALPGADPRHLVFPGESPGVFHGHGFVAPAELNPVRFSLLRLVRGMARRALLRLGRG